MTWIATNSAAARCRASSVIKGICNPEAAWNIRAEATWMGSPGQVSPFSPLCTGSWDATQALIKVVACQPQVSVPYSQGHRMRRVQ